LSVRFGDNSAQIYQSLLERGVIVRPVANYNMPEFLRISVGNNPQLEQMFAILEDIL
jgi:histidinol-phosphate aminotransferase